MIGFIGLGRMGSGIAANLIRSNPGSVIICDRDENASATVAVLGAEVAGSVGELSRRSDVIFLCLPTPASVEEVILGQDGLHENSRPGLVVFDLSTNSLTLQSRLKQALEDRSAVLMDAPVSGGPVGAASGDMAVWVGGERTVFEAHKETLSAISNRVEYVGGFGAGTITKVSHNMIGYMFLLAMAETFSIAVKAGMDPLRLWESLRSGVMGRTSALDMLIRQFLPANYDQPDMALGIALKDMTLGTSLAQELGVVTRIADLTRSEMAEAVGQGLGDKDARAYLALQVARAGIDIAVDPERLLAVVNRVSAGS